MAFKSTGNHRLGLNKFFSVAKCSYQSVGITLSGVGPEQTKAAFQKEGRIKDICAGALIPGVLGQYTARGHSCCTGYGPVDELHGKMQPHTPGGFIMHCVRETEVKQVVPIFEAS